MNLVLKYGGSSLNTISKIKDVASYLVDLQKKGYRLCVVVSAMGKETDHLIKLSEEISSHPNAKDLAFLLSLGENKSSALLSMAINELGSKAISLTGKKAGINTCDDYFDSLIETIDIKKINDYLDNNIVIVAGFQGVNRFDEVTTLGRGGSDTTAVALAVMLNCDCEIYTDVDGVYNIDPNLDSNASRIPYMSYDQIIEMASFGAKVLHTRSVLLAKKYGVKIFVGESLKEKKGTFIMDSKDILENYQMEGIAVKDDIVLVKIKHVNKISDIYEMFIEKNINVEMIRKFFDELTLFTTEKEFNHILKYLNNKELEIENKINLVKVSVICPNILNKNKLILDIFKNLDNEDIEIYKVNIGLNNLSLVSEKKDTNKVIKLLTNKFKMGENYEKV